MLKSKWARVAVISAMALVIPVLAAATKPSAMSHRASAKPQSTVTHVTKTVKRVKKLSVKKVAHRKLTAVHAKTRKLSATRVKHHVLTHRSLHAAK